MAVRNQTRKRFIQAYGREAWAGLADADKHTLRQHVKMNVQGTGLSPARVSAAVFGVPLKNQNPPSRHDRALTTLQLETANNPSNPLAQGAGGAGLSSGDPGGATSLTPILVIGGVLLLIIALGGRK